MTISLDDCTSENSDCEEEEIHTADPDFNPDEKYVI